MTHRGGFLNRQLRTAGCRGSLELLLALVIFAFALQVSLGAPDGFVNEVYVLGLTQPTQIVPVPDGRMFIVHREGSILVLPPGSTTPLSEPLIKLTNVYAEREAGVLGSVLAPDFQTTGHYYIYYTRANPQRATLSRFTVEGNSIHPSSETVIWQDTATAGNIHHGGTLFFGNDGKLYLATGDNSEPADSQNLQSARGKMLRLNPDGSIPLDNPFHDGAGPNRDEIWAYGLRNPFRGYFDAETGRIFVGDVGGNDQSTAVEEIHIIQRGANYGWPVCESNCPETIAEPLYSYPHNGVNAAVIAGFVYRGSHFPSQYRGSFFFADYVHRTIKRLTVDAEGNLMNVFNFEPPDGSPYGPYGDVMDLTVGSDGMIYYLDFGGGLPGEAKIRRIRTTVNAPPVIVVDASPRSGESPLAVSFFSAGSSDPEGAPLTYHWDFGDGTTSAEANPSHVFTTQGSFSVRLTLGDGSNSVLSDPILISVGRAPIATITTPAAGLTFIAGDTIRFSGSATDADGVALPASAYEWTINFRHDDHIHPTISGLKGTTSGEFTIAASGHDYTGNTSYEIELTVTDSNGLKSSDSVSVFPKKVTMRFETVPPGLGITVNGLTRSAPFAVDSLVGFENSVVAPSQSKGGGNYHFTSWEHGGGASQTIKTPSAEQTYTARFKLGDLILSLPFDEGTGTTTTGTTEQAHSGTLANGPVWTAGKIGAGALAFDGQDDYVRVPGSPVLNASRNAITVCAWVYHSADQPGWRCILSRQTGITNDEDFGLFFYDNQYSFLVNSVELTGGTAPANQWTHVAGVYDGANLRLFVNGLERRTSAYTGTIGTGTQPIIIAGNINDASGVPTELFMGQIDEVRIYDRALSPSELLALAEPTDPPDPPDQTAPVISAVEASNLQPSAATVSWATDEASDSQVEYGLSASYGSATPLNPSLLTAHVVSLSGLSPSTIYHYRVISTDAAGNVARSADFTFMTPPDSEPPDLTDPVISQVSAANIQPASATVSWVTDEAADSQVEYGLSASYGNATPLNASPVTAHTVFLSNLSPSTTYHYRVISKDAAGNVARSGDYSFTTPQEVVQPNPLILSLSFDEGTGTTTTGDSEQAHTGTLVNGPSWTTGKVGAGALAFDGEDDYVRVEGSALLNASRNAITVSAWVYHSADQPSWHCILSRQTGTTNDEDFGLFFDDNQYSFLVNSVEVTGGTAPIEQWTHVAGVYDGAFLRLYVNGVEEGSSPYNGTIGTGTQPIIIAGNVNDASGIPTELLLGRIDEVKIFARALSSAELLALAGPSDPTDPPDETAPAISAITASNLQPSSATVSWLTDEASDSQVEYGLNTSYGNATPLNASLVNAHTVFLTGLSPSTTYYYRVISKDAAGNIARSARFAFTTPPASDPPDPTDRTPPVISMVSASNVTLSSATISWRTDEASDSQVEYGLNSSYGNWTRVISSRVLAHTMPLSNLSPSTTYHFRVISKDAAGNIARSGNFTFSTPPRSPIGVNIGGIEIRGGRVQIRLLAPLGLLWRIEAKDSLSDPTWTAVGTSFPGTGTEITLEDNRPVSSQRFYRVVGLLSTP